MSQVCIENLPSCSFFVSLCSLCKKDFRFTKGDEPYCRPFGTVFVVSGMTEKIFIDETFWVVTRSKKKLPSIFCGPHGLSGILWIME